MPCCSFSTGIDKEYFIFGSISSLSDWSNLIVGKISPWLKLDSANPALRKNSELVRDSIV
jgi:hypothetical protein